MKKEIVKEANEILEEIKEYKKFKSLLKDKHGDCAHFEFVQHYNIDRDYQRVQISREYNDRFLKLLNDIISELEMKLESL